MSELYYSLDQQEYKNQVYLVVNIDLGNAASKRLIYKDTFFSLAKERDQEGVAFLIKQELNFLGISSLSNQASTVPFNRVRVAPSHSNQAIKLLAKTGRILWKGKKLIVDPFSQVEFLFEAEAKEELLEVRGKLRIAGKEEDASLAEIFFRASLFG